MSATQAERAAWQRRAAHTLTTILREHPHLPVIAWTITPAGAALTARVTTPRRPPPQRKVIEVTTRSADATTTSEADKEHPTHATAA